MNHVIWSKKSDHWSTPQEFKESLGKIDLDPCPLRSSRNGLRMNWYGRVFVNPPYSAIREWLFAGIVRLDTTKEIIYLLPARTDTKWFHEIVLPMAKEIRFLKGRLRFGGAKNSAPFPSMVVVFKGKIK